MISLATYFLTSYTNPGFLRQRKKQGSEMNTYYPTEKKDHFSVDTHARAASWPQPEQPPEYEDENAGPIDPRVLGGQSMEASEDEDEEISVEQADLPEISESSPDNNQSIVIEARFCTICNMEQPIRAKHCRDCDNCVALHDHHCPWVGVCIGEKNRRIFWWYLLFQFLLLWLSLYILASSFWAEKEKTWLLCLKVLGCTLIGFFSVMVTCLLGFHSFLAMRNQTTWETASWGKISYLKDWPRKFHSPFTMGLSKNLYFYCCKITNENYTLWTVPTALPEREANCCDF